MTTHSLPLQPASLSVYSSKYQLPGVDNDLKDTYRRVARALAENEENSEYWENKFYWALENGATPGGRILSNAGAESHKSNTSLINCVISGEIHDSIDGIMNAAKEAATTLARGSGIGYNFSSLRPKGAYINGVGALTSGSLSFMEIFNTMCFTINSAGGRRGAQMATHFCWHPDVEEFITCKQEDKRFRQFNFSVLITDEFMKAVKCNHDWELYFPIHKSEYDKSNKDKIGNSITYRWFPYNDDNYITHCSDSEIKLCKIYKIIKARYLWDLITKSTYEFSEPGVLFYDRINKENNNYFCENLVATNPCVTGDTLIITKQGSCRIDSVINRTLEIWNGYEWSMVTPTLTSENEKELKVITFSNGSVLKCTNYHKFILQNDFRVTANHLKLDDIVQPFYYPEVETVQKHISVTKIETIKCKESVYCFNEEKNHSGVFNGILTAQCGEQPLHFHNSCLLGSVNLTSFIINPFMDNAKFDWIKFEEVTEIFTRMLDNVVEKNGLALEQQQNEIIKKRRHGMGFYGLGSVLTMLRIKYGTQESIDFTRKLSENLAFINYKIGIELSKEKGPAPIFLETTKSNSKLKEKLTLLSDGVIEDICKVFNIDNYSDYLDYTQNFPNRMLWCISDYMLRFRQNYNIIWKELLLYGCRFTHATTVPPTGTTSLAIGNNTSNGIEPSFSHLYNRNIVISGKKSKEQVDVWSYEYLMYNSIFGNTKVCDLPDCFVNSHDITPEQHILIQSAAQLWCDSSISKTINCDTDIPFEKFQKVYEYANDHNLKGCATFRFNPEKFSGVLVTKKDLEKTKYKFNLENGKEIIVSGNETIVYDGEEHTASNLFDALKEGYYGKF